MPLPFGLGKQKEAEPLKCVLCGSNIDNEKRKPKKEWNLNGFLCSKCYDKKERYCADCETPLKKKVIAEPEWEIRGYVCPTCADFWTAAEEISSIKYHTEARLYKIPNAQLADGVIQTISELEWKLKKNTVSNGISSKIIAVTAIIPLGLGRGKVKVFCKKKDSETSLLLIQPNKSNIISEKHVNDFFLTLENKLQLRKKEVVIAMGCEACGIAKATTLLFGKNLCNNCYDKEFGLIVISTPAAEYFGGHKAHLAGRLFSAGENGNLILTTRYLVFEKKSKNEYEGWKIEIPLNKIVVERWSVKEEARRTSMIGGGGLPFSDLPLGLGGGFMHQDGKRHELVVPYIDENGIYQEPRFGVVSLSGKAIKEWAAKLYEVVVEVKKQQELEELLDRAAKEAQTRSKLADIATKNDISQDTKSMSEDPIRLLKLRLAKGEITREEYEELRKMIES
jgi:hypothetical protein